MEARRGGLVLQAAKGTASRQNESAAELERAAHAALKATFGFDAFRGNQLDAIVAALQGRDTFVLMPTGGGKSLCYGLVPAVRPGLVLVVSPLIALMQDQVRSFRARGLRADFLSSTRTEAERARLLADLQQRAPRTQLLLVTPELLATPAFMAALRSAYAAGGLLLAAIDEAHCISSWGHDFRSSYRQLWSLRRELPRLPLMALTATASERVQADVVAQLRMRDPLLLRASFNRPELSYEVRYVELLRERGSGQRLQTPLPDLLAELEAQAASSGGGGGGGGGGGKRVGATLIYCHRREDVDGVAGQLARRGFACAAYHAGLPDAQRARVLEDWRAARLDVVAATVAFGMGVDRADVRAVYHYSLPKSLEGFYQEAGRAGRDGAPARSIVYYSTEDRQRLEYVLGRGDEQRGVRRQQRQGGGGGGGGDGDERPTQLVQLGQVVEYCLCARCRRAAVLRHFGEATPPPTQHQRCCDVCADPGGVAAAVKALATAGAQRQQRFAGGKHTLDFGGGQGCGRGGGGRLEFESSWAPEGLDYDQEGPSRALDESEGEDAIQGTSSDEEEAAAAGAAMRRARSQGRSDERVFQSLAAAEERFARERQGGSKRARLLAKLGSPGSSGGDSRAAGGGRRPSGPGAELRQTATRQLAAALSGNAALGVSGAQAAAVAAALEQQLAAGASKPVYQSTAANLVRQLKKAGDAADVPALAAALEQRNVEQHMAAAAGAAPAPAAVSAQLLQEQVAHAVRLAAAAAAAGCAADVQEAAVGAAAAALRQLERVQVTADLLQETGAGKSVQKLRKHGAPAVAAAAAACVAAWRACVGV